jgi:hypothetical protein
VTTILFGPKRIPRGVLAAATTLAISLGAIGRASAQDIELEECGGVLLQAAASCRVLATSSCQTECEPVAVEEVCAYRLTTTCEPSCTATADVTCTAGCQTTCVPECTAATAEDQPPNCMGLCMSDCQQDCTATCADSGQGHCRASCAHTCSRDCHDQCAAEPPPVCEDTCQTACSGSCEARANIDCQVSCQSEQFATCETNVVEECHTDCETTGGGIFCDGQFLATEDLEACADELAAVMDIHVDLSVTAKIDADVQGRGIFDCSALPPGSGGGSPAAGVVFLALFLARAARVRRDGTA